MSPFSQNLPQALENAGVLLGFVMSLALGSYLLRDNFLSRLAQYILVGASLAYTAVIAWRNVLWPRLFAPLIEEPLPIFTPGFSWQDPALWRSWVPLALGLLLWGAGAELLRRPPEKPGGRAFLRLLAVIPAAILAGVAVGVGIAGALQGTLWPQLLRAAALGSRQVASLDLWLAGLFTLLLTGGALVHLQFGQDPSTQDAAPGWLRPLLGLWGGLGQRALWLAAGVLFARLVAARFTLVLARLDYFLFEFPRSEFWQIFWAALRGGGP